MPTSSAPPRAPLHILVVEHHPVLARTMRCFLQAHGCEVAIAEDMQRARRALRAYQFDALISDVYLPDGICFSLLEESNASLPGFLVTMSGFEGQLNRDARRSGLVRRHLTKPFAPEELIAVVEELAEEVAPEHEIAVDGARPRARRRSLRPLQPLTEVVLRECARRLAAGSLTSQQFREKLARLEREELARANLRLTVRETSAGAVEVRVEECETGLIVETLLCQGPMAPESRTSEELGRL